MPEHSLGRIADGLPPTGPVGLFTTLAIAASGTPLRTRSGARAQKASRGILR